jgi:hypothetical protein
MRKEDRVRGSRQEGGQQQQPGPPRSQPAPPSREQMRGSGTEGLRDGSSKTPQRQGGKLPLPD